MEHPTPRATATLDRDGLTTIETKRWLVGSLYEETDRAPEFGATNERVASD
ncbi:MAG: hypothetical protein ACI9YT_002748 [Halobacteriales archaeon]|jgi:hypothetical protein